MRLSARRAASFHKYYWLSDPLFLDWIVRHLAPFGSTVCDVGSGTGVMLDRLCSSFARVYALEPSSSAVAVQTGGPVEARQCDFWQVIGTADNLPFRDRSVDVALAKSSLHHFEDFTRGLAEMARIARRAIAVVEVTGPDEMSVDYARSLVLRKEPGRSPQTIFAERDLVESVKSLSQGCRALHFDQYIDIDTWLECGDIDSTERKALQEYVLSQGPELRERMQIHEQGGRLLQLRRMLLVIGIING